MDRLRLAFACLRNSRLGEYRAILATARRAGYQLISLRDYARGQFDAREKIMILRHDLDANTPSASRSAREMLREEVEHNAHASYYFRKQNLDVGFMHAIEEAGGEASLHFETVAEYVRTCAIRTREELFASPFQTECLDILATDLQNLRRELKLPFETIASHGALENRLLDTPNNFLTEDPSVYEALGIKLEAYNEDLIDAASCYISDCSLRLNDGYCYGVSPQEAMGRQEPFVIFLSHPRHWGHWGFARARAIAASMLKGPRRRRMEFRRI